MSKTNFHQCNGAKRRQVQTNKGRQLIFSIDLHQEIFDKNDLTKRCENYLNGNSRSFQECDEAFTRKQLDVGGFKNLTPIWATENLTLVTKHLVVELDGEKKVNAGRSI
jgi:hypothetical protein